MSLPKEPRQKMINMMYLVLTALLALNVSVEVLNAFKTVNTSLEKSNGVVGQKNDLTYQSFDDALKDDKTAVAAKIWAPKAAQAQKYSSSLTTYIESLKNEVIEGSNPQIKDGVKEFTEGDLDAPTRIMDVDGKGKVLYGKLIQYKQDLLNLMDPSLYPETSDLVKKDLKAQKDLFEKTLPLNLVAPKSEAGNTSTGDAGKDWTIAYFHMTPSIAAMTILSKFQSDVKNSESQVIDYLHKQIGEVKIVYNKFQVLAQANASYVMPGDEVDITAGVGAFSDAAKPLVTMNGQKYEIGPDGSASFKTKAEGVGEHTVNVHIVYTMPDGSPGVTDKAIKYTVGMPSGASVFLEKMNVLYIGEENPLTVSGGSVGAEKVSVSMSNGSIEKAGGDKYIAKPTTPGTAEITVNSAGKIVKFPMRIKYLPNPTPFVGSKSSGSMGSAEFRAIGGVLARLENSDFESPFRVVSYKIGAVGGSIPTYQQATNEGARWNGNAAQIISKCSPGTSVFIDEIQVIGRDGRRRELNPMVFKLTQ